MVGIVVVSHSRPLAVAAVALAREMTPGQPVPIATAAGLDEGAFGTDALAVAAAIDSVDDAGGVVVLMDLGSAVLSAEMALEFLDEAVRERVLLCPGPLVEGLMAAVVAAASGAGRAEVAAEAGNGLDGKLSQIQVPDPEHPPVVPETDPRPPADPRSALSPSDPQSAQNPPDRSARFTVTPAHGLHARPAARLVAQIGELQARVEIRNATTGSAWADAASLSRIAALGARRGHVIEARADGEQAADALAALIALADRNFDEPAGMQTAPRPPATDTPAPRTGDGAVAAAVAPAPAAPSPAAPSVSSAPSAPLGAAPGIALGPIRRDLVGTRPDANRLADRPVRDPGTERHDLTAARTAVRERIRRLRADLRARGAHDEAAIFDAHLALLDDPALLTDADTRIDAGLGAARAWAESTTESARQLAALDDTYLAARAADVRALGDQVVAELLLPHPGGGPSGSPDHPELARPHRPGGKILVVEDLTPARAAELDPATTPGVIMAYGSPSGHAAILVRARGIPALAGAGAGMLGLAEGTVVAFDGSTGDLSIDPDQATREDFARRADRARKDAAAAARVAHTPATTRDGTRILVGANAAGTAQAAAARAAGADLIGLVRTEFLFLGRHEAPDVDEQEAAYLDLADAFGGERITLRTLDVGGDKPLNYLPMPAEANPFLGVRGLRLGLRRPDLLADQLRAVLRTARQTPVSVMFPMVSTLAEVHAARAALDLAAGPRGLPTGLRVGIMVEVPAAALRSATLAGSVDFFSIGTNDLTQYTLAAERGNDAVAALGDPFDPAVLQLIRATCAGAAGRAEVAVCGEFAADPRAAGLLAGLGVGELSVTPRALAQTKQAVRAADLSRDRVTAARALGLSSGQDVRDLLRSNRTD